MPRTLLERASHFSDQLFANQCFLCSARCKGLICQDCDSQLPGLNNSCKQCSLPLAKLQPAASENSGETLCGECLQSTPSFDRIICGFSYHFPIPFLLNAFKHHRHLRTGLFLSRQLCSKLQDEYKNDPWPDFICPVPLNWQRRLSRGFNQADFIAKKVSKELKLPRQNIVRKPRKTHSQQNLNRKQRLKSLSGAFSIKLKKHQSLEGAHIAIVDDVVTTSATAEALAHLLKKHGAKRVDIWALARTPKSP